MIDLAQSVPNPARPYPAYDDSDKLPLPGTGPFTVNVKVDNNGAAEFALASNPSTTYSGGVEWKPDKPVPAQVTITFVFQAGGRTISSLSSDSTGLTFGSVSSSQQTGTAGNVGPYTFTINTSAGGTNAKIVVTPIGGGDDGDA